MNILDKLERKIPWFSFPYLNLYMVAIFLVGLLIDVVNPFFYFSALSLNVGLIMSGQIWRLVTFVFYPPSTGIFALIIIFVYYSITQTLIMRWGNFKFNVYLFIGYISQIIGAFLFYFIFRQNIILYPIYATFSIIVAFALSFPNAYFMIYFLIPIKAKYFAYIEIVLYVILFLFSSIGNRVAIICSAVNVFVFFVLLKEK